MSVFYNDFSSDAVNWLTCLINFNWLPAGKVLHKSISDICGKEVCSYTQCHFFAGIGGWPLAIKLAGIPEPGKEFF